MNSNIYGDGDPGDNGGDYPDDKMVMKRLW